MNIDIKDKSKHFWKSVDIKGDNECWNWKQCCDTGGYGHFNSKRKMFLSHRFAYEDKIGSIPAGKLVCHKCDNPKCCNPSHLFIGSNRDNRQDASKKGRITGGGYKLTPAILSMVLDIRQLALSGISQQKIADKYKLSQAAVSMIINRRSYRDIKEDASCERV